MRQPCSICGNSALANSPFCERCANRIASASPAATEWSDHSDVWSTDSGLGSDAHQHPGRVGIFVPESPPPSPPMLPPMPEVRCSRCASIAEHAAMCHQCESDGCQVCLDRCACGRFICILCQKRCTASNCHRWTSEVCGHYCASQNCPRIVCAWHPHPLCSVHEARASGASP